MKHLLEEPVIAFYPSAAILLGSVDRALVLQQLHFLLSMVEKDETDYNFVNNRWWVYNNYPKWKRKYFPWISEDTIQRVFLYLEGKGIVLSMQSVKDPSDRTKWYSIDEEAWGKFISEPITANCDDGSPQTATMIITANCDDDSKESPTKEEKDLPPLAAPAAPSGLKNFTTPVSKVSGVDDPVGKAKKIKAQPALAKSIAKVYGNPSIGKNYLASLDSECILYDTDPIYAAWFEHECVPRFTFPGKDGKLVHKNMDTVIQIIKDQYTLKEYRSSHSAPTNGTGDGDWMSDLFPTE